MTQTWDRRPAFWIAYAVLALACLALAWRLMPLAIPIVELDITMTRAQALAKAEALATERQLAPPGARSALVFNHDVSAQNYIELEGGGKPAFAALVAGGAYAPYWWDVRIFKPGAIEEALIRFRPDGALDGFTRKVAETYVRDPATKALAPDAALALAREHAARDWSVDFAPWHLLDQAQVAQPTGRADHRFVFERDDVKLGDARLRMQLIVTGDELTQVQYFVHVPESFTRRFQEMRSANNTIATIAGLSAGVLYGIVGCILGALWLLRQHFLVWKPPLVAGLVIGALLGATVLANAATAWFTWPTTQDESTFWIRQVGMAALAFVGGGLLLGEVFMASEGLVRRAFPTHPQLWRVWSKGAAGTTEIAGRTAGGYLFLPLELALIATFYYATNRWLGWWQPSEQLTDPDILSSALPALTPIGIALQAGMMEECVFRALPLALGALIGARYGRRRLGIAIAFVLQAVVFGAAHANYPGLPSYSRLVELIVPSMLWAAIFLRYGLLPTILLHALFDLVLISIPLFLIDAPGAWLSRGAVIVAGLVPALVVMAQRLRQGRWLALPDALRNGAWQPVVPAVAAPEAAPVAGIVGRRAAALQRALPVLGLAGLAAWAAGTPLRADAPPLPQSRAEAEAAAAAALAARGVQAGPPWQVSSVPRSALAEANQREWHAFVWREAGPDVYRQRIGNALAPPVWDVRFARFDGDVADRAEEWRVTIAGDGKVRQVAHQLPEGRAGAALDREDAKRLADDALRRELDAEPLALILRSADEAQRPNRRDWRFAYADPAAPVGKDGEVRMLAAIAGDQVVNVSRGIFVPEAWRRAEQENEGRRHVARVAGAGVIVVVALAALMLAIAAWHRGRFDRRAFWAVGGLVFAMMVAGAANNWPTVAFQLRTAEPLANQLATSVLAPFAGGIAVALLMGLLAGVGVHYARQQIPVRLAGVLPAWAAGVAAALAAGGLAAALTHLVPPTMPVWPDLKVLGAAWPVAAAALNGASVVPGVAILLFLLSVIDRATAGWTRRRTLAALVIVVLSIAGATVAGQPGAFAMLEGVIEGGAAFAFAWLVLRYDLRSVPAFVATGQVLGAAKNAALLGTATGWLGFAMTAAVVVALAWFVTRRLFAAPPAAA
ncbi:MAG: CPBP family intramembrane glutamic endopeptidase [Burkholderiales bacterium]